ncbi:MAG TPA: GAF and ANTAR domain-containing protein [Jiangellales bacterium]|nr:GAF and ANTAR domain-containing protein [Jiangellales bacterium]
MAPLRVIEILAGIANGAAQEQDLPQRLVEACALALPVTGAAMSLMTDAGPAGTVAATDGPAATMEELQFALGEGPCVDSSRTGRPILAPDLARTGPARWPGFSAGALEAGIRAIFALPLQVGAVRVGVLDLYRDRSGVLSSDELAEALSFADAAITILLHLQGQRDPDDGSGPGAIPVLEDRAEVHQATGMVAEQVGVSLTQALVLLQARAYAAEQPIIVVSRDVLAGVVHFSSDRDGRIRDADRGAR